MTPDEFMALKSSLSVTAEDISGLFEYADALKADNATMREALELQDIESVPKDEQVLFSKWHNGNMFWAASGELSGEDGKYYINLTDEPLRYSSKALFAKPTHWQSLPAKAIRALDAGEILK